MKRVLLTGMSGTGKSSVVRELRGMGFRAIDMDEPGWSVQDAKGNQLWCEDHLREVLTSKDGGHVFVSGCAENQLKFYSLFTHIILLSAPPAVIRERLATRTNNPYGKRPDQLEEVFRNMEKIEPLLRRRATHEIETTKPLAEVVASVLSTVKS